MTKEKVSFKNSRGLTLVGDFYKANSDKGIILCHGFTGDRHEAGKFDFLAEELNLERFNVITFDFGGSGESEDEALNTENQTRDLGDVIRFMENEGIKKMGVVGMSLGAIAIIKNKELFGGKIKSVVLWAPVTYRKDDYALYRFSKEQIQELKDKGRITYIKKVPGRPREKFEISQQVIEERENLNQQSFLAGIALPILIIHGNKDSSVPLEWSEKAMEFLPKSSKLIILEGETHRFENKLVELVQLTKDWFSTHL